MKELDLTDKNLLPDHYILKDEPYYQGDGNLSVDQLQKLCNDYKEYTHQQALIKQRLKEKINIPINKQEKIKLNFWWYSQIIICKILLIISILMCIVYVPLIFKLYNLNISTSNMVALGFMELVIIVLGCACYNELLLTNCPKQKYNIFTTNWDWKPNKTEH